MTQEEQIKVQVFFEFDEEVKAWSVWCPQLNDLATCGDTREEAEENFKDALALYFRPLPKDAEKCLKSKKNNIESKVIPLNSLTA